MVDHDREPDSPTREDELSEEELKAERAGALPDREALSVFNADVASPADPAIAADVLSGEDDPDHPGEAPFDSPDEPPTGDESTQEG